MDRSRYSKVFDCCLSIPCSRPRFAPSQLFKDTCVFGIGQEDAFAPGESVEVIEGVEVAKLQAAAIGSGQAVFAGIYDALPSEFSGLALRSLCRS